MGIAIGSVSPLLAISHLKNLITVKKDDFSSLQPGPVAILVNEDDVELHGAIAHARKIGFRNICVATASPVSIKDAIVLSYDPGQGAYSFLNTVIPKLSGRWVYWGYNAEYLYYPFCETRTIDDALQFVSEERRDSVFCAVVDLYAEDLKASPQGLDVDKALFDAVGYFQRDCYDGPHRVERQIHIHGGLKWRFAEHVPWARQPIERISLFRAQPGVSFNEHGRLSEPELNTVSPAWHNSMSCAVASFRAAKTLMTNPNSAEAIDTLSWSGSRPFNWTSTQLMEAGLMEPGQWF